MYSKDLIKGTLQPIILMLLKENERMYGYEITQKVKELTKGRIEITEGALYPALHKLEAEGILKTEKQYTGKRVRKYYMLASHGNVAANKKMEELSEFVSALNLLLKPKTSA